MNTNKHWFSANELQKAEQTQSEEYNLYGDIKRNSDFKSYLLLNKSKASPDIHDHNLNTLSAIRVANIIKVLTKNFLFPKKLLELGCGAGFSSIGLKKAFPETYIKAVDASKNAIEYASKTISDIQFECMGIDPSSEINGGPFDLIIAYEFYPFSRTSDYLYQVEMIQNLLNQGRLIIIVNAVEQTTIFSNYKEFAAHQTLKILDFGIFPNLKIFNICKSLLISKILTTIVSRVFSRKLVRYIILSKAN